jgi:hypothetical protein
VAGATVISNSAGMRWSATVFVADLGLITGVFVLIALLSAFGPARLLFPDCNHGYRRGEKTFPGVKSPICYFPRGLR